MMMKSVIGIAAIVATVAAAAAAPMQFHTVIEKHDGAALIWSDNEAYLFIGSSRVGFSANGIEVVWELIHNAVGTSFVSSEHSQPSLMVVHYRPGAIQQRVIAGKQIGLFRVIEGRVYGSGARWDGVDPAPMTADEQTRFVTAREPSDPFGRNNGWTYRPGVLNANQAESRIAMEIGQTNVVVIASKSVNRLEESIAIQEGNDPPKTVWTLDGRTRWVDDAEYSKLFAQSPEK